MSNEPVSNKVTLSNRRVVDRHVDHICGQTKLTIVETDANTTKVRLSDEYLPAFWEIPAVLKPETSSTLPSFVTIESKNAQLPFHNQSASTASLGSSVSQLSLQR